MPKSIVYYIYPETLPNNNVLYTLSKDAGVKMSVHQAFMPFSLSLTLFFILVCHS